MKKKTVLIPMAAVAGLALSLTGTTAEAAPGTDLIRLSHQIEALAEDLSDEFRLHYRHTGAYRHLTTDITKIIGEADHIHRLAHDPYTSLNHIGTDVRELDELAHHLHEVVDATERGDYGGHAHGDTRHVHSLLKSLNDRIHKMEAVIASMQRPACNLNRGHDRHHNDDSHGDRYSRNNYRDDSGARIIGHVFRAIFD